MAAPCAANHSSVVFAQALRGPPKTLQNHPKTIWPRKAKESLRGVEEHCTLSSWTSYKLHSLAHASSFCMLPFESQSVDAAKAPPERAGDMASDLLGCAAPWHRPIGFGGLWQVYAGAPG